MPIHIFIAHMGVGGAERVCVNLANEFVSQGQEVHVIVLNLDNDINTHLLDSHVHVHSLRVSRLRYSVLPMLKYIRHHHPDFLFIFGNEMAVILNKMKKFHLISTPLVVRVLNNVDITLSKEDHISPIVEGYLKKEQRQLHEAAHVIAQCNAMKDMLLLHGLVEKENLTTIYNPVSKDLIQKTLAIRCPLKERDSNRIKEIVFIGRIDPQKNLSHLLLAFAKVHRKMQKTRLRLIGDGNVTDIMQKLAIQLEIEDVVTFEGVRKDMEQVYATADVVALSSEYEGMPNCLIEAIGCGIPIVSYDCPLGPKEIVVNEENGYLVTYNKVEELAERLEEALLCDWNEDNIRQTAQKFNVTTIVEQYLEIFKRFE